MKIQSKILGGFILIILMVLAISTVAIRSTNELDETFSKLSTIAIPLTSTLQNIRYAAVSMNRAANELVVLASELREESDAANQAIIQHEVVVEEKEFAETILMINKNLEEYKIQIERFLPEEIKLYQNLHELSSKLIAACRELIYAAQSGRIGGNIFEHKEKVENIEQEFGDQIQLILNHEMTEVSIRVKDVHQQSQFTSTLILSVSIVLTLLGLFFALIISQQIAKPLLKLQNAAQKVSSGNFETKLTVSSNDEVGALSTIFNTMVADLKRLNNHMTQLVEEKTIALTQTNKALHHEIEEKIIAEEKARQISSTMKTIFNNAIPLSITTMDYEIVQANDAYHALFGKVEADHAPVKCYESRPGPYCHTDQCPLARILDGEDEIVFET
ncbi:MAG: HAMP domain-containing protein [Proteobacteria bacterium]|nr:HAMP domain-containing protein [Pseudomonadota bacterium]MBU1686781.1 HAMP domain-containing protein [Pseudomonadota bacterium]